MIKEKTKISKYNYKKPFNRVVFEFARTVFFSLLFAAVITSALALHARQEMIKNIYEAASNKAQLEKQLAKKLVESDPNLLSDMSTNSAALCLHIGELYEAAEDFKNAEMAYKFAADKAKEGEYLPYLGLVRVLIEQEKLSSMNSIPN